MGRKAVFLIPGYRHKSTSKAYKTISEILKTEGFSPVPVQIPWKQSTITENTEYFLKKYKRTKAHKKYILGFSYGAMIAFLASTKVPVTGLILCSLSPYFQEDIEKEKKNATSILGRFRFQDFSHIVCGEVTQQTKAKQILMLYGTKEDTILKKRVTNAYRQISLQKKHLFPIEKADHNISDKKYLASIHQATQRLN